VGGEVEARYGRRGGLDGWVGSDGLRWRILSRIDLETKFWAMITKRGAGLL
jgi:hypothetical protein